MESKGYYDVQDGHLVWVFYDVRGEHRGREMTPIGMLDVVDQVRDNEAGSRLDLERPTIAVSLVG